MSFIKSIADSLFSPTELREYNKKSPIRVILYVLFLGILLLIPHAIMSVNVGNITYETKVQIRNYFKYDVKEFPIEIVEGKLVMKNLFTLNKLLQVCLFLLVQVFQWKMMILNNHHNYILHF